MFTGIVTHRGTVERAEPAGDGVRMVVRPERPLGSVAVGDSVAVDGVCLTAVANGEGRLAFDVVAETLARTTLGDARPGRRVHLEAALRAGDPLGGHLVEGHVEGTATVVESTRAGADARLVLALPPDLAGTVLAKGAVAVDGVSLTVGRVWTDDGAERFDVHLVPHTLAVTGLGDLVPGDRANVEPDVLGRWVEHHVARFLRR